MIYKEIFKIKSFKRGIREEVMNMKKDITLYHYCSTNKQPRHENCPMEVKS